MTDTAPDRSLYEPLSVDLEVSATSTPDIDDRGCMGSQQAATLDLDASPVPYPSRILTVVLSAKVPRPVAGWVAEEARRAGMTPSRWLLQLVEQAQHDRWPVDVQRWLLAQGQQCGCPGDVNATVIEVVRHLATRWPDGARLR